MARPRGMVSKRTSCRPGAGWRSRGSWYCQRRSWTNRSSPCWRSVMFRRFTRSRTLPLQQRRSGSSWAKSGSSWHPARPYSGSQKSCMRSEPRHADALAGRPDIAAMVGETCYLPSGSTMKYLSPFSGRVFGEKPIFLFANPEPLTRAFSLRNSEVLTFPAFNMASSRARPRSFSLARSENLKVFLLM